MTIPIIDITDLYHPFQDPGDNFDILSAYCLPEIDLRAVILDTTERFRRPYFDHPHFGRTLGPRDPGFIPLLQLNHLSGRTIPFAAGPFESMRSPRDTMELLTPFQASGINLLLHTLRHSEEPVDILCFGSLRTLAVAFNRAPDLLREKVNRLHISAGADVPDFLEWNVELDPHAMVCILESGLPMILYPCATADGPFSYGQHNTFWQLPDLKFIPHLQPELRRYLDFAFAQSSRPDFLRAVEEDLNAAELEDIYARPHNVWETALWMQVTNRLLVQRADHTCRIVPEDEILASDTVFSEGAIPCHIEVQESGVFSFTPADEDTTNIFLYERDEPEKMEAALRQALPALYQQFHF